MISKKSTPAAEIGEVSLPIRLGHDAGYFNGFLGISGGDE
jgi:hypothetical protein